MRFSKLSALLLLVLGGCASIERAVLPAPELADQFWLQRSDTERLTVDHAAFDNFLQTYVATDDEGINRVNYKAVSDADRSALRDYIERMQLIDVQGLTAGQQLAYWINLYNAVTIHLVLESYPVASIREINDGPLSIGPWDRPVVEVAGFPLTLNDIEHRIIRPVYDNPRIHYALNCAAKSCPNLAERAWRAEGLEQRLEQAERSYVNDRRGLRFTRDGRLVLSKIYIWFQEDFGEDDNAVLRRLEQFAEPELQQRLADRNKVDLYAYDWALNEQGAGQL